jgi:endonuclease-3
MLRRIRATVREFADAAMFALAAEGRTSVFEQLVACIISIRTRDEVMLELARGLLLTSLGLHARQQHEQRRALVRWGDLGGGTRRAGLNAR